MEGKIYHPRLIDSKLSEYLSTFGAVCVEGPKWCGKTWTSLHQSKSSVFLGDPSGNFQNRELARLSPDLVLDGATPRLIDEWQEVPSVWDAVRHRVDQHPSKGQFILTGSATPNHKGIMHSGAGRIARLRMRPMSLWESGDSSGGVSLEALCRGELDAQMHDEPGLLQLVTLIVRGGWPAGIGLSAEQGSLLAEEYLNAVIEDDVYRIDGVKRDTGKIRLLLHSLARNESTTAANRTLKNDIKAIDDEDIDAETVSAYLDIFKRLFLTDNQPPFSSGIRSSIRVKQAEKRHFADPSLACALLRATPKRLLGDLKTLGFLFEALCARDLRIYAESFGASLYHYQNYNNRELDAVIGMPDGSWCAIEIKLGADRIDQAAENLITIRDEIAREKEALPPAVLCVVCGLTKAAYRREDGVFVVPITALRP